MDRTLTMPVPYVPITAPDDYRCFILDWPETAVRYATGFNVTPANPRIVHHVAAYLIPPDTLMGEEVFDALARWDAADKAPGYTCFGGPSGPEELQIPVQQLAQWVPVSGGTEFPDGTGIEVKPGSKVVLQLDYNLDFAGAESDQTSFALKLDSSVERRAAFAPYLNGAWPLGEIEIQAGQTRTFTTSGDPRGFFGLVIGGQLDLDARFDIHSALLHQHGLGASSSIEWIRGDGAVLHLLDIPDYNFHWQMTYAFEDPLRFLDGDQLRVMCSFDNSAPGAVDVNWGEGTGDEMWVANLYISEVGP